MASKLAGLLLRVRQRWFLSRPGEGRCTEHVALKGVGECKVPGLGCGLHAAPGYESLPAGCGVLANSPLEKVRDGQPLDVWGRDSWGGLVGELGCLER